MYRIFLIERANEVNIKLSEQEVIYAAVHDNEMVFAVHLNAQELANDMLQKGMSILQVFAEKDENFYIIFIVGKHIYDLQYSQYVTGVLFEKWVSDVGAEAIKNCMIPNEWVRYMARTEEDD